MADRGAESTDERAARNLRALRERNGISGRTLAQAMSERGHAWHQQTVTRIETLAQPMKLAEAADVAAILGTSLDRLMWTSPEASAVEYLYSRGHAVRSAYEDVASGVQRLLAAAEAARRAVAQLEQNESPRVREARADTIGRIEDYGDPAEALAEGARRHAETGFQDHAGHGPVGDPPQPDVSVDNG